MTDLDERPDELQRYVVSMRRRRRWYLAAIAAVVAAAVAVALVVWFSGEITHVHMRTARSAPPPVAPGSPAAQLKPAWQSEDRAAIGSPFTGGTVVTYSRHTVTGRDALHGTPDWTYTRTDRTVCEVVQVQNKTVALYDNGGNCDQVSAFDTGTGRRAWYRTLDENGLAVDGHPTVIAASDAVFVTTSAGIYAIGVSDSTCDPNSGSGCGGDQWTFRADTNCRIGTIAPGTSGVLIEERCADGNQLVMRDRYKGDDDKQTSEDKKHQILWRAADTDVVPLAADSAVVALDPVSHELVTYDAAKGKVTSRVPLTPAPSTSGPIARVTLSDADLVWIDGRCYAIGSSGTLLWSAPMQGPPTAQAADGIDSMPTLTAARILAPTPSGAVLLDSSTGTVRTRYAMPAPPADGRVFPLGDGLLVAGTSTAVYR